MYFLAEKHSTRSLAVEKMHRSDRASCLPGTCLLSADEGRQEQHETFSHKNATAEATLPESKASNTAQFSSPTTNKSTTTIMRFSNYSCLLLSLVACGGGGGQRIFGAPSLAQAKLLGSMHDDYDDGGEPAALLRGNNNNKAQEGGDRSLMFHHHSRELANNANADYDVISGGNDNQIALESSN
uniref:Uncharacterized protein n=1 Tax=Grammatophora oceanica TaxID=210454 RepID=A0A7S1UVP9_9STRA|mmetsp:Transcript_22800/g.33815  ORF Transcript_22800/g.33815 Transcript_22800/m.33815 type:complete len:184 (+) Transcript_22800:626-1177(+)